MTTLALAPNTNDASVAIIINGAPMSGSPNYNGTAESGLDSWTALNGSVLSVSTSTTLAGSQSWRIALPAGNPANAGATRTLTGLTVGVNYMLSADVMVAGSAPTMKLGINGIGYTNNTLRDVTERIEYVFKATATSHTLRLVSNTISPNVVTEVFFDSVRVQSLATGAITLTRTDINGSLIPVRLSNGQGLVAGAMTVIDFEPALAGPITYRVVDGAGQTFTATTYLDKVSTPQLVSTLRPSFRHSCSSAITDYQEARESTHTLHDIIGRTDTIAILGQLKQRRGTMVFRELTRMDADRVASVYFPGEIALVRYPYDANIGATGMADMYHVATRIQSTPMQDVTNDREQHWLVTVEYVEVLRPEGRWS